MAVQKYTLVVIALFGVSCSNGGSLTTELNASFGMGNSQLVGSCQANTTPLVLVDGYCVEYIRPFGSSDDPGQSCSMGGGTFTKSACPTRSDKTGRCWERKGGSIDLTYFAGTPNGPDQCEEAGGSWQDGTTY